MFVSSININQMVSSRRCVIDPDNFCYTCGEFTPKANRKLISDFYKNAYRAYFQVELGDQDKNWAPHIVCKTWLENMRLWTSSKLKSLRHAISMIWREPQNHFNDCYFCFVSIAGLNQKKRWSVTYPSLSSAIWPVPHSNELPVQFFRKIDIHNTANLIVMSSMNTLDTILTLCKKVFLKHLVKASSMTWFLT